MLRACANLPGKADSTIRFSETVLGLGPWALGLRSLVFAALSMIDSIREANKDQSTKTKAQKLFHNFSGDFVGRVTPVPIPNTEVKPAGADGTARVTAWESRKSPGLFNQARSMIRAGFVVYKPGSGFGHIYAIVEIRRGANQKSGLPQSGVFYPGRR